MRDTNVTQLQVRDMQRLMRAHELRSLQPETKRERDVQLWEAWLQKYWYRLLMLLNYDLTNVTQLWPNHCHVGAEVPVFETNAIMMFSLTIQ
jgi:hypothetical protein